MPRRLLKRLLPTPHNMRAHKSLQPLARLLHDPNLWHLNRRSVSLAAFVGIFMAFLPLPIHMIGAAIASILLRCNLTIAVVLVWISNPLTIPPMFYSTYRLGAWMLDVPAQQTHFELSWEWLREGLGAVWQPLMLGSLTTGLVLATAAYAAIRLLWRLGVQQQWRRRQRRRSLVAAAVSTDRHS